MLPAPGRPASATYSVDDVTHRWQVATFDHVARCKQLLIDWALSEAFDYIFFVDSDLLLEPTTLLSLYACDVDVVSGVFWTQWTPADPPLPQTWLTHPYGLDGLGMAAHEYLDALSRHELVRVAGGGACMLVKTGILDRVRYHPRLDLPPEGMWQGEDRTWAILMQQNHLRQYADGWPRIHHAYHPAQRTAEALDAAWADLAAPTQQYPKAGDWVNIRLTPLQDPGLEASVLPTVRNARGRLVGLPLAPELEEALTDMMPGDRRIIDVTFPPGHPIYPPCTRAIMMELIDVRPN